MIPQFGQTRSDIRRNHALLTPESHEWITDPDWPGAEIAYLISPDMGSLPLLVNSENLSPALGSRSFGRVGSVGQISSSIAAIRTRTSSFVTLKTI